MVALSIAPCVAVRVMRRARIAESFDAMTCIQTCISTHNKLYIPAKEPCIPAKHSLNFRIQTCVIAGESDVRDDAAAVEEVG